MKLYKIEKNFLSAEIVAEIIKILESNNNWEPNLYAPERLTADIKDFPILEDIYKKHFSIFNLFDNRIYFTRYGEGTQCLNHVDVSRFTVLIILKKADAGGEIKVGKSIFDPDVGDALVIKGSDYHEILTITKGHRLSLAYWLY